MANESVYPREDLATELSPGKEASAHKAIHRGLEDLGRGRYRVLDAEALRRLGRSIVARGIRGGPNYKW